MKKILIALAVAAATILASSCNKNTQTYYGIKGSELGELYVQGYSQEERIQTFNNFLNDLRDAASQISLCVTESEVKALFRNVALTWDNGNIQGTYHLWKKVSADEITDFDKVSGATIVDTYTLTFGKSAMDEATAIGRENVHGTFAGRR